MAKGGRGKHVKVELKGFYEIYDNLNKVVTELKGATPAGLLEVTSFLYEDMLKTPPTVPKDTGNLRASYVQNASMEGPFFIVQFGFTANYALWVHEMVGDGGKEINWKEPGSGPKFFEEALKRNEKKIIEILGDKTKIE